ncbi:MAG: hypothetical protein GYA21_16345 [Myxococcales bacterium]|nr:hypothetical protein [Myxococcales bacterium]
MKTLAFAFSLLCAGYALAGEPDGAADGVLLEVAGEVWRLPLDGEAWAPAAAGTALAAGDSIRTGKKSRARVRIGTNIDLRLGPNAELQIEEPESGEQPVPMVSLLLGWLQATVSHAPGEKVPFEVHTGNAVAGVRGTEFVVAAGLDGLTRAEVLSGEVAFAAEETEVAVGAGYASEATEGAAPLAPGAAKTSDWEAWQEEREGRARERAEEMAASFTSRVDELAGRLDGLRKAESRQREKIRWLIAKLSQARRANQPRVAEKARERLLDLMAQQLRLHKELRRAAVRLSGFIRRLVRLEEAIAGAGGEKAAEALAAHPRLASALRWLRTKDATGKDPDRLRALERERRETLRQMAAFRAMFREAGFTRADLREARERLRRLRGDQRP